MPHAYRRAVGVNSASRKHVVRGIVSSKSVLHRAFLLTSASHCLMCYRVVRWGQGDTVMVDADGARRASGAWLASRSQPAAPPVADFLTVAALPGLSTAARAELHDWIQVEPHLLACLGQTFHIDAFSATCCSSAGRQRAIITLLSAISSQLSTEDRATLYCTLLSHRRCL